MKSLIHKIKADISNHQGLSYFTILFLVVYRTGRALHILKRRNKIFWAPYIIFWVGRYVICCVSGASIPFSSSLGNRVIFQHGIFGVFISGNAVIGDDCIIMHQVTIGSRFDLKKFDSAPVLGRGVFVGPGAKIIGGICIGDFSKIGPNAVVVDDVAHNSVMVAPKAINIR